jgi:hypothetical protein
LEQREELTVLDPDFDDLDPRELPTITNPEA